MAESREQGRRKLADRDRAADAGERAEEYRHGNWSTDGDPADRARQAAVEENLHGSGDRSPGMTPRNEEWQREKQRIGQIADEPGLPRTWRDDEQPRRKHHRPEGERMGRPLRQGELPDSDTTQG